MRRATPLQPFAQFSVPLLPCRRPYTPTTSIAQRGFVDFVIKLYPDGQMSQILAQVRPASCLLFAPILRVRQWLRSSLPPR